MSLEVLIVDDQAFCIEQLSATVRERAPDAGIQVAATLEDAAALASRVQPDLILVELSLPGLDREAGVATLCRLSPAAVLVLDARDDPAALRACARAGARGYVTRSSSRELVSAAVAVVLAGGRYFPAGDGAAPVAAGGPASAAALSERQAEVLGGLMLGQTNLEIGQRLGIALPTVKVHVRAVLRALGARNRTEAALLGRSLAKAGLAEPADQD